MALRLFAYVFWGFALWLFLAELIYEIHYGGTVWWFRVPITVGISGCFMAGVLMWR